MSDLSLARIRRGFLNLYRREILRDRPLLEAKRWFADRGDVTLRLDYPLTPDSIVVDLGGYLGQWAQDIHDRYGCTVHLFEPVPRLYEACRDRFAGNAKIHVHGYGLSDKAGEFALTDDDDASSFVSLDKSEKHILCELRSAPDVFDALGLLRVDLLKINIEGGEYQVLPALLARNWTPLIDNFQIQFHTVGDFHAARQAIQQRLRETHDLKWCYEFVWEGWTRSVDQSI